jgi:hypothetical protein
LRKRDPIGQLIDFCQINIDARRDKLFCPWALEHQFRQRNLHRSPAKKGRAYAIRDKLISPAGHSRQNAAKQNQDDDGRTDPNDHSGGKLRWLVTARHGHLTRRPVGRPFAVDDE